MMNYKIIDQSARLITPADVIDEHYPYIIEYAGRACTGTEHKAGEDSYAFIDRLIKQRHLSVLEHCSVTCELVTSRAIANQLVRHRIAAYSQQSMRFVKFGKNKAVRIIKPFGFSNWSDDAKHNWYQAIARSILSYEGIIAAGCKAEEARGVLPMDAATKLIATWNLRTLMHILYHPVCGRKDNPHAQPQVQDLMTKLVTEMYSSRFLTTLTSYDNSLLV